MKNVIEVHTKKDSSGKAPLYLLHPWIYENSYHDPMANRIPNGTKLSIGNIGYYRRTYYQEIIVFFEDSNGRLIRALEFTTERPQADLEQLLHLLTLNVTIHYSAENQIYHGYRALQENINFYNETMEKVHQIPSDSHVLIRFNNGSILSESFLRQTDNPIEKTIPFLINRLFPKQEEAFPVSEAIQEQVRGFYRTYPDRVIDDSRSNLTFDGVKNYHRRKLENDLLYTIQYSTPSQLTIYLNKLPTHEDSSFLLAKLLSEAQKQYDEETKPEKKEQREKIIAMLTQFSQDTKNLSLKRFAPSPDLPPATHVKTTTSTDRVSDLSIFQEPKAPRLDDNNSNDCVSQPPPICGIL